MSLSTSIISHESILLTEHLQEAVRSLPLRLARREAGLHREAAEGHDAATAAAAEAGGGGTAVREAARLTRRGHGLRQAKGIALE